MLTKIGGNHGKGSVDLVAVWKRADASDDKGVNLTPLSNGWLDNPLERGSFLLRIYVRPTEGVIFSAPFFVHQNKDGKSIVALDGTLFPESGIMHYAKSIPVLKANKGRKSFYYTHKTTNNAYVAAIEGNKLALILVGIASQNNDYFLHQETKYEAELFQQDGELVIPRLSEWTELPGFIASLVDVDSLPDASEYIAPSANTEIKLGTNQAEVLWCNPFAQQIALRTQKGNALLPFKYIRNLAEKEKVVNPKPGTVVTFQQLADPDANSQTQFPYIAKGVTL
ncbi:hypothetical protein IPM19_04650 [bacterium]|nr:MAG: hypothetical protein IPM19_04650 [bacterium]